MSGAPGGGGYCPLRCITSGRFTPAARTRTRISLGPGAGTGRSSGTSTSGPPGLLIPMAVMRLGKLGIGELRKTSRLSYDSVQRMTTAGTLR
jgi:hypothetical protein